MMKSTTSEEHIETYEAEVLPADMPSLKWVERVSKLMDSKFKIPGTKIKFGLDPIFSVFPVLGDLTTYAISAILIYTMHRHGASQKVVVKMITNATVDMLVGSIPILGTIFDVFYKANNRNVRLLKEHYHEGRHEGSGKGQIIAVLIVIGVVLIGLAYLTWKVMYALYEALV